MYNFRVGCTFTQELSCKIRTSQVAILWILCRIQLRSVQGTLNLVLIVSRPPVLVKVVFGLGPGLFEFRPFTPRLQDPLLAAYTPEPD